MDIGVVADDMMRGYVVGRVIRMYERKISIKDMVYRRNGNEYSHLLVSLTLPTTFIEKWKKMPKSVVLLETDRGDLVIMNPEHAEKLEKAFESYIKMNKARIEISHNVPESSSILRPILKKYKGGWKAAARRSRRKRKSEE